MKKKTRPMPSPPPSLLLIAVPGLLAGTAAAAELKLAAPFTDHLVLQRELPVPVWGEAEPGATVTVAFAGRSHTATADAAGHWRVRFDPLPANAEPGALTVRSTRTIVLHDVLVGEVWLCAGQSNMQIGLERLKLSKAATDAERAAIAARVDRELATTTPGLRCYLAGTGRGDSRSGSWHPCGPAILRNQDGHQGFSAAGYFFARHLQEALQVPVGVIAAAVGNSRIETWTPAEGYAALPAFAAEAANHPLQIDGAVPGRFFAALIRPLAPFALRGVNWYQGESNVMAGDGGRRYADKLEALIGSWRAAFEQPGLPFHYVQLPPMDYGRQKKPLVLTPLALPQFREGQALALRIPATGMIVTTDLAPVMDLHPADKWDVGGRLARLALNRTYGHAAVAATGPVFRTMEIQGGRVVLSCDQPGAGLASRDGLPLTGFALAGADRRFVVAEAVLAGDRVVVSAPGLAAPVAVRFAWQEDARPNLVDRAGLPAAPFRSDDWPVVWTGSVP